MDPYVVPSIVLAMFFSDNSSVSTRRLLVTGVYTPPESVRFMSKSDRLLGAIIYRQ